MPDSSTGSPQCSPCAAAFDGSRRAALRSFRRSTSSRIVASLARLTRDGLGPQLPATGVGVQRRARDAERRGGLLRGEMMGRHRDMLIDQSRLTSITRIGQHSRHEQGLDNVVAATTRLSHVDGEAGRLTIAGYAVDDLAPAATFEDVAYLLLQRSLPEPDRARPVRAAISPHAASSRAPRSSCFAKRRPRRRRPWTRFAWRRRC